MGDKASLGRARQELEDLYLGVPDESVNVTLKDIAILQQQNGLAERKINNLDIIHESPSVDLKQGSAMGKSPSIDFTKGLQAAKDHHRHVDQGHEIYRDHPTPNSSRRNKPMWNMADSSLAYNDVSALRSPFEDIGGRSKRPGIPHTNICTVCSVYIYIFRHRCLVCGRVYCRQCVGVGMGEMTEGRKCIECLGRRFSQRYIQRAGQVGCCAGYSSIVKQQELLWAEKGPRKSGERRYGRGSMVSQSRSPLTPRTPTRAHASSSPPSFVMHSPYSPSQAIPF